MRGEGEVGTGDEVGHLDKEAESHRKCLRTESVTLPPTACAIYTPLQSLPGKRLLRGAEPVLLFKPRRSDLITSLSLARRRRQTLCNAIPRLGRRVIAMGLYARLLLDWFRSGV